MEPAASRSLVVFAILFISFFLHETIQFRIIYFLGHGIAPERFHFPCFIEFRFAAGILAVCAIIVAAFMLSDFLLTFRRIFLFPGLLRLLYFSCLPLDIFQHAFVRSRCFIIFPFGGFFCRRSQIQQMPRFTFTGRNIHRLFVRSVILPSPLFFLAQNRRCNFFRAVQLIESGHQKHPRLDLPIVRIDHLMYFRLVGKFRFQLFLGFVKISLRLHKIETRRKSVVRISGNGALFSLRLGKQISKRHKAILEFLDFDTGVCQFCRIFGDGKSALRRFQVAL